MFGELSASYKDLTAEQRAALAELVAARAEYQKHLAELNGLRVTALASPTDNNEAAVRDYAAVFVTPARLRLAEQAAPLLGEAVNADGLKGMAPMLLMGAMQSVNLPLLLGVLGLEPDMIDMLLEKAKEFFKQGM